MFTNLLSTRRDGDHGPAQNLRTVNKLGTALAELPAPWRVLRNRRASAADGPPWVKYIVLHPEKGIALVDILPANPHAAIAPLDEFLARTGFAAFSHGDPPIVGIALGERDIARIGDHLTDAFAGASPCGIKNMNWTDAVVELLLSTSGLFLTPIEPAPAKPTAQAKPPVAERSAPAVAPRAESVQPRQPQAKVRQPEPELPRVTPRREESREEPKVPQQPAVPRMEPAPQPPLKEARRAEPEVAHVTPRREESKPPQRAASLHEDAPQAERVRGADPPRLETPSPSQTQDAAFLAAPDPEWRVTRPAQRKRTGRRTMAFLVIGGALAASVAAVLLYSRSPTPSETIAKTEPSPARTDALPTPSSNSEAGPAAQTVAHPPSPAVPPNFAPLPFAALPPSTPVAPPARTPAPPAPSARAPVTTKAPAAVATPPAAAPATEPKVREAYAKPAPSPRLKEDRTPDGIWTPPSDNEETITINGTTYIKGREPQALGTVMTTEPPLEPEKAPSN